MELREHGEVTNVFHGVDVALDTEYPQNCQCSSENYYFS